MQCSTLATTMTAAIRRIVLGLVEVECGSEAALSLWHAMEIDDPKAVAFVDNIVYAVAATVIGHVRVNGSFQHISAMLVQGIQDLQQNTQRVDTQNKDDIGVTFV